MKIYIFAFILSFHNFAFAELNFETENQQIVHKNNSEWAFLESELQNFKSKSSQIENPLDSKIAEAEELDYIFTQELSTKYSAPKKITIKQENTSKQVDDEQLSDKVDLSQFE